MLGFWMKSEESVILVLGGVLFMTKKRPEDGPTLAPGLDEQEELNEEATEEEVEEGEYTKVTSLVWDEYDPSGEED